MLPAKDEDRQRVQAVQAVQGAGVLEQDPVLLDWRRRNRQCELVEQLQRVIDNPRDDRFDAVRLHQRVNDQRRARNVMHRKSSILEPSGYPMLRSVRQRTGSSVIGSSSTSSGKTKWVNR